MENLLLETPLFGGINKDELKHLLEHLQPKYKEFAPGTFLLMAGNATNEIGVVLQGEAAAYKLTPAGREFTVATFSPGGIYGDVLFGSNTKSPVTISATAPCRVMLLGGARLFSVPADGGAAYTLFLQNLLRVISEKYFSLDARVDLLLTHSLRQRISNWLLMEAERRGSHEFTTDHTRASLATYLDCDRSALSRELSRMAAEGLIETKRGYFKLPDPDRLRGSFWSNQ